MQALLLLDGVVVGIVAGWSFRWPMTIWLCRRGLTRSCRDVAALRDEISRARAALKAS